MNTWQSSAVWLSGTRKAGGAAWVCGPRSLAATG